MRMTHRATALFIASALDVLCVSAGRTAFANGRMAAGHQLVVSPTDPNYFVMETTFGLLFSHDGGRTFAWVCESPIGYGDGGIQDPSVGMTSKYVLAGLRQGLSLSPDLGCSWNLVLHDPVVDVVVRRDDPHTAYALTSKYAGTTDAGDVQDTKVMVTHDDGDTWTALGGPVDPTVMVETIELAPSDPNRIYIGGARRRTAADGGLERAAVVLFSKDHGATYGATDIALDQSTFEGSASAFVSAVDPSNPNRVYVRLGDGVIDRLVVSDDGAMTFVTAYQARGALLGFALSSDGSKVFIGGPLDGVQAAPTATEAGTAFTFAKQSSATVTCLTWAGNTLYSCMGQPTNSYIQQLGASTDDGVTFATRSLYACMTGPLVCPGCLVANACLSGFPIVQARLGSCSDGGVPSAPSCGTDDGGSADIADASANSGDSGDGGRPLLSSSKASCGCSPGDAAGGGGVAGIATALAMALRRRRRQFATRASAPV